MTLSHPFQITAGLYPGLKIGNATLECREALNFVIVFPGGTEYFIEDFRPGAFADLQGCFAAILGFLGAWVEAIEYSDRTGRESDNLDLFDIENPKLKDWAVENGEEISMLSFELEEKEGELIID